jgi:hypothetical protein
MVSVEERKRAEKLVQDFNKYRKMGYNRGQAYSKAKQQQR